MLCQAQPARLLYTHLVCQALKVVRRNLVEDTLERLLPLLLLRVVASRASHHIPAHISSTCACMLKKRLSAWLRITVSCYGPVGGSKACHPSGADVNVTSILKLTGEETPGSPLGMPELAQSNTPNTSSAAPVITSHHIISHPQPYNSWVPTSPALDKARLVVANECARPRTCTPSQDPEVPGVGCT